MKVLEALKIHRGGDAHVVTHHHTAHPPDTYKFKDKGEAVGHLLNNLDRLGVEEREGSEPDSWSGGRPASFDYGSTREGEIQGRRK